jgi:non-lysosomal glucosylceramidase
LKKINKHGDVGKYNPSSGCCSPPSNIPRRDFIKFSALGLAASAIPFSSIELVSKTQSNHLIPADKMLSAEWIKSLTDRGSAEVYSSLKDELKYIGMPIGGVCSGQLYISGDGRLWLWNIFQSNYTREGPENPNAPDKGKRWRLDQFTFGGLYSNPRTSSEENNLFQVKNGFSLQYKSEDQTGVLSLDKQGFEDITFRGEYPVAKISYKNTAVPVTVKLTAYSPFIPLNVKDSAIPATVLSYEVTNTSDKDVSVDIGGWLENRVCPELEDVAFTRTNEVISDKGRTTVFMSASGDGLSERKGYGDMAISILGNDTNHHSNSSVLGNSLKSAVFETKKITTSRSNGNESLVGSLSTSFELKLGESKTVTFLVSWYFPYYNEQNKGDEMGIITDFDSLKRYYASFYASSNDVASYVSNEFERLSKTTLTWNETWYDSTLPYWLLDRSFISLDCLATQTSHLFDNNRFWGWEGVECCEGTCTHVWQYAQGLARIFPSIERDLRENIEYGLCFKNGVIDHRAEYGAGYAIDGQLGTIIRVYREHQMSSDATFLRNIWKRVKESMQLVIDQDQDGDGLIEGEQPHTLDARWFGPMGWISGMYLAALKVCEEMALEMGDHKFAKTCSTYLSIGQKSYVDKLFNGEYFIHLPPDYNSINTNKGCHIDQVLGQSMAYQVNVPDVLPKKETRSALQSLWKYNFAPDAGQYAIDHTTIKGARLYAMPGEAGLLMTTWPIEGDDKAVPRMAERPDDKEFWLGPGGYFDECMNGFEYQVSSHMVWEGMLTEGLSIMKAVHERYNGAKRNPYDEIECSSHYSRSMASYGTHLAACGFSYHGPKGELGFAPKIKPEDFKGAFTTADGWGSFAQKIENGNHNGSILLNYGQLLLKNFNIELSTNTTLNNVLVYLGDTNIPLDFEVKGSRLNMKFKSDVIIKMNEKLRFEVA